MAAWRSGPPGVPSNSRRGPPARNRAAGVGRFLLLSHLDVVPAPADRWTHDPFAADVAVAAARARDGADEPEGLGGLSAQDPRALEP